MLSGPAKHLHIVMNDPVFYPERGFSGVLLVNVSSIKPDKWFDDTCVLEPGEHPFIRWRSFVMYSQAVIANSDEISQGVAIGEFATRDPVDEHIYERVSEGFELSKHVKPKIKRFIKNYMS